MENEKFDYEKVYEEIKKEYENNRISLIAEKEIERRKLDEKNQIMKSYLELIKDLSYDYDGLNTVESLKGLIDNLNKYAGLGMDCNTSEPVYENNGVSYNILHEEIK